MRLPVALSLALSVLAGCDGSSGYPTGSEKGRCYPNGMCNAGLTCRSDTCVNASPAAGAGGSAASDGAAGAAGDTADVPIALDVGGARDGVELDTCIRGTGGTMRIDAPILDDGGQRGGGGSDGGGRGGSNVAGRAGVESGGRSGSAGSARGGGASGRGGLSGSGGVSGRGGSGSGGSGGVGLDGGGGTGGGTCGFMVETANRVPADVLLVLDRSASMDYSVAEDCTCTSTGTPACANASSCTDRWSALAAAVDATLTSTTAVNWGLKLYPSLGGSSCAVSSSMEVPISAASVSAIRAQIANADLGLNTPTAAAISAATAYLETATDVDPKAILLATDGEPNCKAGLPNNLDVDGTFAAISAARDAGFLVYVVGIGPSVGNLEKLAQAGGTGHYYPATSTTALTEAFAAISQAATTCTFTLETAPPDPSNLAVYLDKSIVPQDSVNGWSFGASSQTIVFGGSFCDMIIAGSAANVQALFGCPGGPPFPQVLP